MATYVPNAFDATQPTEEKSVESAALEFRTVKVELIKIDTVYGGMAAVTTVANDLNEPVSEIETVATNIANVNAVGTDISKCQCGSWQCSQYQYRWRATLARSTLQRCSPWCRRSRRDRCARSSSPVAEAPGRVRTTPKYSSAGCTSRKASTALLAR